MEEEKETEAFKEQDKSEALEVETEEAAKKWLQNGAQPTDVVARLFKQAGIEK